MSSMSPRLKLMLSLNHGQDRLLQTFGFFVVVVCLFGNEVSDGVLTGVVIAQLVERRTRD